MTEHDPSRLLLGWQSADSLHCSIGFAAQSGAAMPAGKPVYADREAHLCTIASTGAGKNRGQIIPALLSYEGSIICLDPKGENTAVTASWRRRMGQEVHVVDPFGVTGETTASLDPIDCLSLRQGTIETEAEMLAQMLFPPELARHNQNVFWDNLARDLVSGLLIHAATTAEPHRKGLVGAYRFLSTDDLVMEIAKSLDKGLIKHPYAYRAFAQFLALGYGSDKGRVQPDTLSTARSHLCILASDGAQKSVSNSTIRLADVIAGKPMTIYLVMPLEYLESHSRLLRLWIASLVRAILLRRSPQAIPTLLLLDEIAALGHMPILKQAITTLRGYGVRVWSFWQNMAQMRHCYPTDWETITDNCKHLTIFGLNNYRAARETAEMLGVSNPASLLSLEDDQLALARRDGGVTILKRPDYLSDEMFRGRATANPYHVAPQGMSASAPTPSQGEAAWHL